MIPNIANKHIELPFLVRNLFSCAACYSEEKRCKVVRAFKYRPHR